MSETKFHHITTAWRVLRLRMEVWRVAANIEEAIADADKGVVLQFGGWAWG
jgi:hypothetical protein